MSGSDDDIARRQAIGLGTHLGRGVVSLRRLGACIYGARPVDGILHRGRAGDDRFVGCAAFIGRKPHVVDGEAFVHLGRTESPLVVREGSVRPASLRLSEGALGLLGEGCDGRCSVVGSKLLDRLALAIDESDVEACGRRFRWPFAGGFRVRRLQSRRRGGTPIEVGCDGLIQCDLHLSFDSGKAFDGMKVVEIGSRAVDAEPGERNTDTVLARGRSCLLDAHVGKAVAIVVTHDDDRVGGVALPERTGDRI